MHRDGAADGVRLKGHQQVAQREPEIHDYRCVTFRSLRKARCRPVLQMAFASVLQSSALISTWVVRFKCRFFFFFFYDFF